MGQTCAAGRGLSRRAGAGHHCSPVRFQIPPAVSSWLYIFAWVGVLADQLGGIRIAGDAAGLATMLFLLIEFPRQRRYAQALFLTLLGVGLVGVALSAHPWPLFIAACRRAGGYAAFFLALGLLRDAAETSRLVRRCGEHLVAQPPGRRYLALAGGGMLFGVILSYGVIDLFGAMVARANTLAAAGGSAQIQAFRARRMMMAVFRGFALMNCWNPLGIMTGVVFTAFPAAPMRALLPIGLLAAFGMYGLGWLEDRMTSAGFATAGATRPATVERWTVHLRIFALVVGVTVASELATVVFGVQLVTGVTVVVPIVGVVWMAVQTWRFGPPAMMGVLRRRLQRFRVRVPSFRGEATVLGASGFMAVALGGALPPEGFGPVAAFLPAVMVPMLVPLILVVTGQLGFSPIAIVALIGAAVPDPGALGLAPAVLAFGCMMGWGVGIGMTALSASAITTARWAGADPWTVTAVWNTRYTILVLMLAWAAILAMYFLWPA